MLLHTSHLRPQLTTSLLIHCDKTKARYNLQKLNKVKTNLLEENGNDICHFRFESFHGSLTKDGGNVTSLFAMVFPVGDIDEVDVRWKQNDVDEGFPLTLRELASTSVQN